jgi:hypothetical protein
MSQISFDAESIITRVINNLRSKISWAEVLNTSTSRQIVEPISEELAYEVNYDNFLTRENKWNLARNKTSLLAFTGIHRYEAHRKIGSQGILTLSADKTFNVAPTKNITIPVYTQFSSDSGIIFVSKNTYAITTSDLSIDIDIIQGIPRSFTYVASGDDFEEFDIDNDIIENSFYELYVNDTLWGRIENIFEADIADESYELTNKIDFSGIYIKFGNNINGKKLENGDIVEFKYVDTLGFDSNIESSNTVINVDSTILNIDGESVDIFCKNDDAIVGGQDVEELEEIRKNAPKFFQTGDRASNNSDYEQIILDEFSYVLKVLAWGTYENNIDQGLNPWENVPLEDNNVFVATIRTDGSESLSTAQKLEISERLNEFKAPTDIVQFVDGQIVHLIYEITAYISNRSYTLSDVKNSINLTLKTNYDLENREFFEHIRFSDYQRIIDEAEGVDYHHSIPIFYDKTYFSPAWTSDLSLPMFVITPSTVEVYIQDIVNDTDPILIGTDNGLGSIIGEPGYTLTGSTISYNTGIGAIILDNVPPVLTEAYTNYEIKTLYRTSTDDLVLKERYQTYGYDESLSLDRITTVYTST